MRTTPRGTRAVMLVLLLAGPGYAQEHEHVASTNEKLLRICERADKPGRPEIEQARAFLRR